MDLGDPLERAKLALTLLAIDPYGLAGICLRGRAGGAREMLLQDTTRYPMPQHRLPPDATDERLYGGLDLAATLESDHLIHNKGVLDTARTLILPMAERIGARLAGRLGTALDTGRHCIIALDEGTEEEALPPALLDRVAFYADVNEVRANGDPFAIDPQSLADAKQALPKVQVTQEQLIEIASVSASFGIASLRAQRFALRAALAYAALNGQSEIMPQDIEAAAILTLGHRATAIPEVPPPEQQEDEPNDSPGNTENEILDIPDDMLLEAIKASLPDGLLDRLATKPSRGGAGSGSGSKRKSNRRGRPLPSRPGRLDGTTRIDVIATLRAAAPWQTLRKRGAGPVKVWPSDIHVKRYEELSDRLLIFTVDASGSAALARLAEAKGAIELLLSDAYARRDHVALVAFRGQTSEVLLSPTRSLVQTKRRLAGLPGGGGTPLASGLESAMQVALTARASGLTPTIILLTDGRANIARDGEVDRIRANDDAQMLATAIRSRNIETLVIDTAIRPAKPLSELAASLGGTYLPLPRADAHGLSKAVVASLAE